MELKDDQDFQKFIILLDHWIKHNDEHSVEYTNWAQKLEAAGYTEVSRHLKSASELLHQSNQEFFKAKTILETSRT
ncbi:MAG: hypothetical protein SVW57_10425 [Thermodesulfobacteriota bacterium]|nr:hypothetical protein [Thermodesulfobacteriota bacterium]